MGIRDFVHKHYRKFLIANTSMLIISLVLALATTTGNKITAFSSFIAIDLYRELIFSSSVTLFVANLGFTGLLIKVFNPEKFKVGSQRVAYTNTRNVLSALVRSIVETNTLLTGKNYALYLFNKKKEELGRQSVLNYIDIQLKRNRFVININPVVENISKENTRLALQSIVDQVITNPENARMDNLIKTLIQNRMDIGLVETLDKLGVKF